MKITREADYAIRAVLDLAALGENKSTRIVDIAERQMIPKMYLNKIIQNLAKRGLVASVRGVGGGVSLAVDPHKITLLDIVEIADGPVTLNRCIGSTPCCEILLTCAAHGFWLDLQDIVVKKMGSVTIGELVNPGTSSITTIGPG